jgi:hypothetical protein
MSAVAVSDKSFGPEVLVATMPVLVEFTAGRAPANAALSELAQDLGGKIKVARVDVQAYPTLREEYGVRGLPALILFKHGKPIARRVGSLSSKADLVEWIDGAFILALATRRAAARSATAFNLANGLQVVVIPDHRAPLVTQMVWYKAGSADEPKDCAGLARFVSHLSFRSLNRIAGGNYNKAIWRMGGLANGNVNSAGSVYWQRVPRDKLKLMMVMEADRMARLDLTDDDVAIERQVVLERRSSTETGPNARLVEMMNAAHRTHRLPTIDLASAIARLCREDALDFHKSHYGPNNAVLVVSGDVTAEGVKLLAEETFGRVPANADVVPPSLRQENTKDLQRTTVRRVAAPYSGARGYLYGRTLALFARESLLASTMQSCKNTGEELCALPLNVLYQRFALPHSRPW